MSVTVNGEQIYPQTLKDFVKTPDGLRVTQEWFNEQEVNYKPIKDNEK